jgi:hypothetical protein
MSKMKNALAEIANCEICEGSGMINGWVSPDGDFDFEWCDCNPNHLSPEEYADPMLDICVGCNENKVSITELYCLNCYLANNAEADYTEIDQLWLTKENA